MENKKEKRVAKGISIRTVLVLFLILSVTVFVVMGFVTFTIPIYNNKMSNLSKEISECQKEVSDIKDYKEYLTRQARLYVENRNLIYLNNYYNEVNKTKRLENAINSLENRNLGEEADASLQKIVSYAERLMAKEAYAMKLAALSVNENSELPEEIKKVQISEEDAALSVADKRSKARSYLFGREYVELADDLRQAADLYVNHITDGLDDGLKDLSNSLYILMVVQRVCIA